VLRRLLLLALLALIGRWAAGELASWLVGRRPTDPAFRR
jgi:hypothetical protein